MFRQLFLFSILIVFINNIAAQIILPEAITAQKVQKVSTQQIINFPRVSAQNQKLALRTPTQTNKYILRSRSPARIINKRQPTDGGLTTQKFIANNALRKEHNPQNVRIIKLAPKNGVNEKIPGGVTGFKLNLV